MKRLQISLVVLVIILLSMGASITDAQQTADNVYLAYVQDNVVKLADFQGYGLAVTGPEFQTGQSARLFWTPDGEILYIARRDGLFEAAATGGAAARLPGDYGLTVQFDRTAQVFYYLESTNPQATDDANFVTFPLREVNAANMAGGSGRLVGYAGRYSAGTANMTLNAAALQYARDAGLLGPSRPQLFPAYGNRMLVSCCFPDAGLQIIELGSGQVTGYPGTETLIAGATAINETYSRLAGPTTDGQLLIVDLITGGWRSYPLDTGEVERVTWSPDERYVYLAIRTPPQNLLLLNPPVTTPIDTRSAGITIGKFDLVTGTMQTLARLGDFYGVSSMAATRDYVFAVVVESNARLVEDLNAGRLPGDIDPGDAALVSTYLPGTILYRLTPDGREAFSILANVWGIVARPRE